jgi:hypothetical protein
MYNPDQLYQAHTLYLKDVYQQAERNRMLAVLTQHRHVRAHATWRLGVLLAAVGTWLARTVRRAQPPALAWSSACSESGSDEERQSQCLPLPGTALQVCTVRDSGVSSRP